MAMNGKSFGILAAIALLSGASAASAQGAWSSPPPPSSAYPSRPIEQTPTPSPARQQAMHRGYQGAFHIGVPIWLKVDSAVVRPGADLYGFGAYDMGYVAFGLGGGAMWNPINFDQVAGVNGVGRRPLTRLYLSPEVRVQIPNTTPIMPYLGISFDANWWRIAQTDVICGQFYCRRVAVFLFSPGFTAKFGLAFRVLQGSYIDIGVKYSYTGAGQFFSQSEQWITPYVGMLFR